MKELGIPALTPEWFARRREAITATDVPKILGLSAWGTALDVWARITGKLPPEEADAKEKPWLEWGRRTEELHRQWAGELAGCRILPSPGLVQHDELPWLLATPDGALQQEPGCEAHGLWEGKAPSPWKRSEWDDGNVPLPYQVQVQTQLAVCATPVCLVSNLSWPRVELAPLIEADADFQGALVEFLFDWWETHIVKDTPPEPTGVDLATIRRLHPKANATTAVLAQELEGVALETVELQERLAALRAEERKIEAMVDLRKAKLLMALGAHESASVGESGIVVVSRNVHRAAYTVPESDYRTFQIKMPRPKE